MMTKGLMLMQAIKNTDCAGHKLDVKIIDCLRVRKATACTRLGHIVCDVAQGCMDFAAEKFAS